MVSAISEYATVSVVLEGQDRVKKLSGKLAANYKPGTICIQTGTDTWTAHTGTVSANREGKFIGVLEFKRRTSPTFGEIDIDTAYSYGTKENVELIVGPLDGTIKVAVFAKDQGEAAYFGRLLRASSGGKVETHGTSDIGLYSSKTIAMITEEGYASGDTVAKVYLV